MSNILPYFQDNDKRARRAITWNIISIITAIVGTIIAVVLIVVFAFSAYTALGSSSSEIDFNSVIPAAGIGSLFIIFALLLVIFAVLIVAAVFYLMWLHRAHQNAVAISGEELILSAGWHVGFHFIPLANLVMPFILMYHVANKSAKGALTLVKWYIGLSVTSTILSVMSNIIGYTITNIDQTSNSIGALSAISSVIGLISLPISIALIIVFIFVIHMINKQQKVTAEEKKMEIREI